MSSDVFWAAAGLMLVVEGLFPFVSPGGWRNAFKRLTAMRDGQIRFFGLCSIAIGLVVLWLIAA